MMHYECGLRKVLQLIDIKVFSALKDLPTNVYICIFKVKMPKVYMSRKKKLSLSSFLN